MNALWALGGAGAGLIAGSFAATIVIRWPEGRSVMRGRSRCDACDRVLGPIDLLPLFGFLLRRGRCATCGARIDRRHLAIELIAAGIGAVALGIAPGVDGFAGALFGWWLLTLAALDLEHFWLPDALTLSLLALGLATGAAGLPPPLVDRAIGALAGYLALAVVAWAYRRVRERVGLGGGDPKLFAAIGAWIGWTMLPWTLLIAASGGLGYAAFSMLRGRPVTATTRLPFGMLLAAAGFALWIAIRAG